MSSRAFGNVLDGNVCFSIQDAKLEHANLLQQPGLCKEKYKSKALENGKRALVASKTLRRQGYLEEENRLLKEKICNLEAAKEELHAIADLVTNQANLQIDEATSQTYEALRILEETKNESRLFCPICLGTKDGRHRCFWACGHTLCDGCYRVWDPDENKPCPTCRTFSQDRKTIRI